MHRHFKAVLRAQMKYKPAEIRLRIDGKDEGEHDISNVCVCNGRWAGGGMMFAPEARVADGMFDVVLLRATSTLRGLPVMAGRMILFSLTRLTLRLKMQARALP